MIMIDFLTGLTQNDNDYVMALFVAILVASTLDFLFGWANAGLNKKVTFESGVALRGIVNKLQRYITLVFFVAIAFLVAPTAIATGSIYTLLIGYLASEANSVLSHLGLTEDGKEGDLFIDFLKRIFEKEEKQEDEQND